MANFDIVSGWRSGPFGCNGSVGYVAVPDTTRPCGHQGLARTDGHGARDGACCQLHVRFRSQDERGLRSQASHHGREIDVRVLHLFSKMEIITVKNGCDFILKVASKRILDGLPIVPHGRFLCRANLPDPTWCCKVRVLRTASKCSSNDENAGSSAHEKMDVFCRGVSV